MEATLGMIGLGWIFFRPRVRMSHHFHPIFHLEFHRGYTFLSILHGWQRRLSKMYFYRGFSAVVA
jgi:hypothetical protein